MCDEVITNKTKNKTKTTVFSSGSCRLLLVINTGLHKINSLHSLNYNFIGQNFLGKLHNTRQHIQFLRWILGIYI